MKQLRAFCVGLALVGFAVVPRPANADAPPRRHYHAWEHALAVAEHKAYELWKAEPCGGLPAIRWEEGLPEAKWQTPTGEAGRYNTPPTEWTDCTIQLPPGAWTKAEIFTNWVYDCTTILHEWGHLTGHVHTDEPGAANAPGLAPDTPEQSAVMLSGRMNYREDLHRCGWRP